MASVQRLALVVTLVVTFVVADSAQANTRRFAITAPGGIIATGNTLGLSKATGPENGPGVRDSIGTFTTLDATVDSTPADDTNPYPLGTTSDWHANGSTAHLQLREGGSEIGPSSVLYAELLWGGSDAYGGEDVTADLDTPVTLSVNGASISVTPSPDTALDMAGTAQSGFGIQYYFRSAEVTQFISDHRSGDYSVEGVPATQADAINSLNAAGWTLVVVFRDDTQPERNLTVFVGGSFVDENTQEDYSADGFCAPPSGNIEGKVAISAIEGDANLTGDQLLIAPTTNDTFVNLSGPNNPADNFFCSQMNDGDGNLDTTGTFGDRNQDAFGGANIVGGRQGWDVTTVPVTSAAGQLVAGQQSAVLRTITTGDSYVPTLAAFQIDVNAPNLTTSLTSPDASTAITGDTITITSTAHNTGTADASSLVFSLPLPQGMDLVSVTSDGSVNAVNAADLALGVDEGALAVGATRTVVVVVSITGPSVSGFYSVQPVWSFEYVTCTGQAPESETFSHGTVITDRNPVGGEGEGEGEGAAAGEGEGEGAAVGEGEGEGAAAGEGEGEGGGVALGEGEGEGVGGEGEGASAPQGCGCATGAPDTTAAAFAALAGLAIVGRRARRRS
ncbi:MAG TPA: MYXO-CTERM sorting domain-containing protein [Myxococcota bacterium]